ncbi:MAG TPA: cytochrome c [Gaiellaceae bacterium]
MLSTIALVVAALSTGHKIGLAAVGAAFIVFALVSSFVIPRRNPNFPGRGMAGYIALCVLFFVAMLAAVLVFGRESSEAKGNESQVHTSTVSGSLPGQTTSTPSSTSAATTTAPSGGGGQGDAAAGKAVFTSAGCSGCHTLKAAGATGNVGPNLDQLKPSFARVKRQVIHGGGPMPAYKGQLTDKQIDDVAAFVSSAAGS